MDSHDMPVSTIIELTEGAAVYLTVAVSTQPPPAANLAFNLCKLPLAFNFSFRKT